jgi:hypothetical protein
MRSMTEGESDLPLRKWPPPSTIFQMVPLPVPGRIPKGLNHGRQFLYAGG